MLTVVIVAFKSKHLLEERILEIGENKEVLIVDNSRNLDFKKYIEEKYPNVKVMLPKENMGFGKSANIGIKKANTKFVFLTQPDLVLIDNCIKKLVDCIKNFENFTIITPLDLGNKDFVNFEVYNDYKNKNEPKNNIYDLKEVDYVDLSWLINKKNLDPSEYWDENFFLYFEAPDFSKRLKNNNKKIFIAKNIHTSHLGSKSHEQKYNFNAQLTRNWHYNWSRFYFLKKHHGYFSAMKKTLPVLLKISKNYLLSFFVKNKGYNKTLISTEIRGLISSYLNRPSDYRPYEKNKD